MCLLVKVAANTQFPLAWFLDAFGSNPDGLGLSFVRKGKVVVRKTLPATAEVAYAWWQKNAPKDTEYALHWRWRTHGAKDLARVHPYPVVDGLFLMHNGVLSISGDTTVKSDTELYAESYAKALAPVVHDPLVQKMIASQIGGNNRFIFISATHGLIVVNESTGVTTEMFPGCWFSNTYAWTPSQWGVRGAAPSRSMYSFGGTHSGFGPRDDETDWETYYGGAASFVPREQSGQVSGQNATSQAPGKLDAEGDADGNNSAHELVLVVGSLFNLASDRASRFQDATAQRFLRVYDNTEEFLIAIAPFYQTSDEALTDVEQAVDFLADGSVDFDDVLEWYTAETVSVDSAIDTEETVPH